MSRQRRRGAARRAERLEDRALLVSNLNFAGGQVIFGGSPASNNVTVAFVAGNYVISDTADTVAAVGGLAGLDLDANPNSVTFNPAVLAGFTRIVLNGNNGNDTFNVTGWRGPEGLRVSASAGTDTFSLNTNLGSAGTPLTNFVEIAAETINLGGSIYTNGAGPNGNVSFNGGPVTLTANSEIDAAGTVSFGGTSPAGQVTINGAFDLDVDAAAIQLRANVGGTTPLASVDLTTTGLLQIGVTGAPASITAVGDIDATSTGGGVHVTSNITSSGGNVALSAANLLNFTGGVLQTVSGGDITLTGAGTSAVGTSLDLAGTGAVTVNDALTVDVNLVATGATVSLLAPVSADDIFVTATTQIDVADSLTASAGSLALNAPLTNSLAAVPQTFSATTNLSITGNFLSATDITATAPLVLIGGDWTVGGDITINGGVQLNGVDLINTLSANDISVTGGAIDDLLLGTHTLELVALNLVSVTGGIGTTVALDSVLLSAGAAVNVGAIAVVNDVTFEGGAISISGAVTGGGIATFRPQTAGGDLEVYNLATAPASLNMTVDGADLGALAGFTSLVFGSATTGTVTFFPDANPNFATGSFVLPVNTVVIGGTVVLQESVNQGAFTVDVFTDNVNAGANNPLTGTGAVTITKLTPGGTLNLTGNIGSSDWGASNLTIDATGADIAAAGQIGSPTVASVTIFGNTLNDTYAPAISANGDININVATYNALGGVQSLGGDISITGDVSLGSATSLLAPGGSTITVGGSITGNGFGLTVRGQGGALASVNLGDISGLGALAIDSSLANTALSVTLGDVGATSILVRGVGINLDGTLSASTGNLQLVGAVSLLGNVTLNGAGASNRFVRIDGTVNGGFDLNINNGAGTVVLNGVVGGVTPLENVFITSGGTNTVTQNATVNDTFSWINLGGATNKLTVLSGRTISAGVLIYLESGLVVTTGATLSAPTVTIIP